MLLYENIKQLREEKGISQRELARRINMSGQMISKIEKNETTPSIETLTKIAEALGVSPNDFLIDHKKNAACLRDEISKKYLSSTSAKEIYDIKTGILKQLHILLSHKSNGNYLALKYTDDDIEEIISRLVLLFEIEIDSRKCHVPPLLTCDNKEGE